MAPSSPDFLMILYVLRFCWVATRGYRLRPWRSPYLRWRIETYSGIPAESVTFNVFWSFLWKERKGLWRFLQWGADLRRIEKRRCREGRPA
jgi:hypothetical protein